MVTLLYFARLREAFGVASEQVELPQTVRDVAALTQWLRARGGAWESELAPDRLFRVAVNQQISPPDGCVADGNEIAFLPPVTGG